MNPFEKMGIDEDFNPFYKENKIKEPTSVQAQVIPKIMQKKSVLCVAETGSGKTLSYVLPICELIKQIEDEEGPTQTQGAPLFVVVVPTKELAVQINTVIKKLSHHIKIRSRTLVGTTKSMRNLKEQAYEVLVSTPSKLARSLKKKDISFHQLKHLVFDEADQLFDMGFKKDIDGILRHVEYDDTEVHFFSATMTDEVETFLDEKFKKKKLAKVNISGAHKVKQKIETFNIYLSPKQKKETLKTFLQKTATGRGIVFVNQKNQVEEVDAFIKEALPKLKYRVLHGGLSQKDRLLNHKAFINKKAQVLICTDIAARGIDIKDIGWVFNYGLPKTPIYYLHRCGRTGRAGRTGVVYNLVTHFDSKIIGLINDAIKKQSSIDVSFISQDIKKKSKKSPTAKKKIKSKRVKITKRTKL